MGAVTLVNPQGHCGCLQLLSSEGNRVFSDSSPPSCTQSLLFCLQGFYNESSLYVTAGLCYTSLLASRFASSTQGSQKNCTDTEGNWCQSPQSEANSSVNSILQIVQLMHRARKQFAQGQMPNCWQRQALNQEYKHPRPDPDHWDSFPHLQSSVDASY